EALRVSDRQPVLAHAGVVRDTRAGRGERPVTPRGGTRRRWRGGRRCGGAGSAEALEDFAPAEEDSGSRVGENHFAGAEALAFGDLRWLEIDKAGFRAGDEQAVMAQGIAERTEAIAVELATDEAAIGKDERSGSFSNAGGTRASSASSGEKPCMSFNSKALSRLAESLTPGSSAPNQSPAPRPARIAVSLARSQRRFETMVLISPLWARQRKGCANCQEGCVLVE